ncbi:hypothetical protein B0H10DRAFT_1961476 [Mycena sp. CBHHK59/15]|nr:hypothetical protein B0H10DRAFT_1961476 [Mycena sp. CBHHK59/15]
MSLCVNDGGLRVFAKKQQSNNCPNTSSQISPQLSRILYAYRILPHTHIGHFLFRIHLLLGLSWDELRTAIGPLRSSQGDALAQAQELLTSIDHPTFLERLDCNSLLLEFAKGGLHVMGEMNNGCWPSKWARGWGYFLRSCPPSPDLLHNVSQIDLTAMEANIFPHPEDVHNVVQWLSWIQAAQNILRQKDEEGVGQGAGQEMDAEILTAQSGS